MEAAGYLAQPIGYPTLVQVVRRHFQRHVVGYERDVAGISQAPYADRHCSVYPETKAIAERMVLEANGSGLATVALRPHLVFGPGDQNLLPSVVRRARDGPRPLSEPVDRIRSDAGALGRRGSSRRRARPVRE